MIQIMYTRMRTKNGAQRKISIKLIGSAIVYIAIQILNQTSKRYEYKRHWNVTTDQYLVTPVMIPSNFIFTVYAWETIKPDKAACGGSPRHQVVIDTIGTYCHTWSIAFQ